MTIGIGILTPDGPVIGMDQLETEGQTKTYRCKITLLHQYADHKLIIGSAGNRPNCDLVIAEVNRALTAGLDDKSSDAIRRVLKKAAKLGMRDVVSDDYATYFFLLVSAWETGKTARLFAVSGTNQGPLVFEVKDSKAIGVGMYVADPMAKQIFHRTADVSSTILLMCRLLRFCKDNVDGCGGNSDIFLLTHSGNIVPIPQPYIVAAEYFAIAYDSAMMNFFLSLSDPSEPMFQSQLRFMKLTGEQLREQWWKPNGAAIQLRVMLEHVLRKEPDQGV